MARARRSATRASATRNAPPDVYQEMLVEAGVDSRTTDTPERPLKRRKGVPDTEAPDTRNLGSASKDSSSEAVRDNEAAQGSASGVADDALPTPTTQTLDRDSDDDDDDDEDIQFEDVDFETWLRGEEVPDVVASENQNMELELNLSAQQTAQSSGKNAANRRKPLTREERDRRAQIHQTHLLCLLSHVARRNHWCNDSRVQDSLRPHLTDKVATYLTPKRTLSQFGQSNSLKTGMEQAGEMWKTKFEITERGLRRALWAETPEQLQDVRQLRDGDVEKV